MPPDINARKVCLCPNADNLLCKHIGNCSMPYEPDLKDKEKVVTDDVHT